MQAYILKRLLLAVPTLVGVSLIIFLILRVVPGDVALVILSERGGSGIKVDEKDLVALRHELGTDRPIAVQYVNWAKGLLRLDPGKSMWTGGSIRQEIAKRFPISLEIAILGLVISLALAIPMGVVSAIYQDRWPDYVFRVLSIGGLSMPSFWTGTLIILFLVIWFRWTPPLGHVSFFTDPMRNLSQLIWPALPLGYALSASVSRMTRSAMLEVLREDYVRTARAKGLRESRVIVRHAMKNAVLPVLTLSGIQFGHLLGGTVITETVFAIPGMGRFLVEAIGHRDYPVIQTLVLISAAVFVVVNLVTDLVYGWLDPRIRYG